MYLWLLEKDDFISSKHKIYYLKKNYPNIFKEFQNINFKEHLLFVQLFWHFLQDDFELKLGLCPICGKRCNFEWRKIRGYRNHCSEECYRKDINAKNTWKSKVQETWKSKDINEMNEINNKRILTYRLRFGVDNISQTEHFKEKLSNTWKNKTQDELNEIEEKRKSTKLYLYNYEYYNNGKKISNTLNSKPLEFWENRLNKSIQTTQKIHGVNYYSQTTMWKNSVNNTWNNKSDEDIQNMVIKCQKTSYEKFGETSYAKTHEFAKNHTKKIEYDGLTFDSSWEVDVYKFCKEHNLTCEYQPDITFEYEYDGKKHVYHPDFLINGKLYEVKGEQFFDEKGKMINPYNRNDYTDGLAEAKHQCMLQNKVIFLRKN